ncbi:MAG: hypothetical protein V1852_02105 [Pseudomonadota bacterium]
MSRIWQFGLLMVVLICSVQAYASNTDIAPKAMNITGTYLLGAPLTFTVEASSQKYSTLYYKFFYCANYGTAAYESSPWVIMQEYSTTNSCTYTFPQEGSYIVVARVVSDPNNEPVDLPIIGGVVTIGSGNNIHIAGLSSAATSVIKPGTPVKYTVTASGSTGDTLYYKWFYRADYGTSDYDPSPWVVAKDYSVDNSYDYTFPNNGSYIIVVRAVTDPNNEPADLPIIGATAICNQDTEENGSTIRLIEDNLMSIGNQWTYQVHYTKYKDSDDPVDEWETANLSVTGTANISGFDTVIFQNDDEEVLSYQYLSSEYLAEVKLDWGDSNITVLNNDPWELMPVWVSTTDNNRHIGHGKCISDDNLTANVDSYITYLRQETITVPAGTYECVVVSTLKETHADNGYIEQIRGTHWISPGYGTIKQEQNVREFEDQTWYESERTSELTSTNLNGKQESTYVKLPDTGQTTSYTDTFGEDSDYTINSQSYTKLDSNGNALPLSATEWVMIKDNLTGLIWENKTNDGGIHDKDNTRASKLTHKR